MTMRPRLPRGEGEWVGADCDALQELAQAYAPTLAFASGERFYPVLAEAYLAHTSYGPWPADSDPEADTGMHHLLPVDEAQRGTALVHADRSATGLGVTKVGGAPNARGRPLQLSTDATDPDAIGRGDFQGSSGSDLHLVFGGWADLERTHGDEAYVASVFSEFGDAMNPTEAVTWQDPARANLATPWIPQPVTPTTYAEVVWSGQFPDLDAAAALGDFAGAPDDGDNRRLDEVLQVTYHYLFPVRRPARDDVPPGERITSFEGQWQAVTVVFAARSSGKLAEGESGPPAGLQFREPPLAAVLSNQMDADTRCETFGWDSLDKFPLTLTGTTRGLASTSAVVYVGQGTHTFLPRPASGEDPYGRPDGSSDADDLGTGDFEDEGGVGGFFWALLDILIIIVLLALGVAVLAGIAALIALALAAAAVVFVAIGIVALVVFAILAILAIIVGIAWLEDWFDDDGKEPHRRKSNEEATGDGTAAEPPPTETDGNPGPPAAGTPPSGGHDDPSRTGSDVEAGAYASGVGAPRGHNHASFDVRVIDQVNEHALTPFPPPAARCERPVWWDYRGAWGVPVHVRESSGWANGRPRVDEHGRSWAYWHAVRLDEYLSG